jgi:transcriptional regulator with XRE-family HTH domain
MSTAIATPKAANTAQDTVARNVKMMIEARELPKKDFAKVLGVSPQMVARKLRSDTTWSINDMQAAAAFLNVDMATLLQPNLTVPQIYGLGDNNDDGTGGSDLPPAGMGPRYLVQPFSPDLVGNSLISGYTFSDGATPEDYVLAA